MGKSSRTACGISFSSPLVSQRSPNSSSPEDVLESLSMAPEATCLTDWHNSETFTSLSSTASSFSSTLSSAKPSGGTVIFPPRSVAPPKVSNKFVSHPPKIFTFGDAACSPLGDSKISRNGTIFVSTDSGCCPPLPASPLSISERSAAPLRNTAAEDGRAL